MEWQIRYFNERVQNGIEQWPVGIRAHYARITERMQIFGPNLGMPFTRPMGQGLFKKILKLPVKGLRRLKMNDHDKMIEKWKKDPAFMFEYDALEDEFALLDELLKARANAGMTQEDVALAMNTKAPAVARIESGGGRERHSPSVETLRKYAKAVGCRLKINLKPI